MPAQAQTPPNAKRVLRRIAAGPGLALGVALLLALVALMACATPQPPEVTIVSDGTERALATTSSTVNQVLKEAGVSLGELDRVTPPTWSEVTDGMRITVIRVTEKFTTETQPVPYTRQIMHDEGLPAGETRLIQAGAEGVEEFTYRIVYEDGVQVSRSLVKHSTTTPPVQEILVVGAKGDLPPVEFPGVIAYASRGNAWIMRENSSGRRPITSDGDLDQHVFSLSPNGRTLLFTRALKDEAEGTFNSLWIVTTTVKGEVPFPLDITNVLWAQWSPKGDAIAFSTAEPAPGAPGWKAQNDLWIAEAPTFTATQVLSPTANMYYSWWGTTYQWSPNGESIAYANAGEIGVIDPDKGGQRTLVQFPPYDSGSAWAWTPGVSWSPDSLFLTAVVHRTSGTGIPEESPVFDLWTVSADGSMVLPVVRDVGMWAAPVWSPSADSADLPESQIAFGVAENPSHSQLSLYELYLMDRDGSNRRQIFPPLGEKGTETVDVAWSPQGDALAIVFHGDLYLLHLDTGSTEQLTSDGGSSLPRWAQ